jgi:hypothetical protein
MAQEVRLERQPRLPEILTQVDSKLSETITLADEASKQFKALQVLANDLAKTACPHFKPDLSDGQGLLCSSGQGNITPFRGRTCTSLGCKLSQVIIKNDQFYFIGDEAPEDVIFHKIFAPAK